MNGPWDMTTKDEIERLSYLKNPRTAAVYLGIPQVLVEDVWAELPKPRSSDRHVPKTAGSGLNSHLVEREQATTGSGNLRDAIIAYFRKWEQENGFKQGAGEILIPAGWGAK